MGSEEQGEAFFSKYGLDDVALISDPKAEVYKSFRLGRGTVGEIFNLKVWKRGYESAIKAGHGIGMWVGDGFQMPGVFLIYKGKILREFRHDTPADRPDYVEMASSK